MRISHKQLERCLANPRAWLSGRATGRPGMSYSYATQLAIYKFHKLNDNSASVAHLTRILQRAKLNSARRGGDAEDNLRRYIQWFSDANPIVVSTKLRISLDIGSGWFLGGEISRIDIDIYSGFYTAVLLESNNDEWRSEARMPLLQLATSNKLQRLVTEVAIGVQDLDGTALRTYSFSRRQINAAMRNARALTARLSGMANP
jgi:hypothetical protein